MKLTKEQFITNLRKRRDQINAIKVHSSKRFYVDVRVPAVEKLKEIEEIEKEVEKELNEEEQ